jgi:hypothetical protein
MATPTWSRPTPSGAYEFGFNDGSTQLLPPTPAVLEADASLPNGPIVKQDPWGQAPAPQPSQDPLDNTYIVRRDPWGADVQPSPGLQDAVQSSDPYAGATASAPVPGSNPNQYDPFDPYKREGGARPPAPTRADAGSATSHVRLPDGTTIVHPPDGADPKVYSPREGNRADNAVSSAYNGTPGGSLPAPINSNRAAEASKELPPPASYPVGVHEGGGQAAQPVLPKFSPGSPGKFVPGTMQVSGRVTEHTQYPEEVQQFAAQIENERGEATDQARAYNSGLHRRELELHDYGTREAQAVDQRQRQEQQERAKGEKEWVERQGREIDAVEETVNPDRYWDNKSTLENILLRVALFVSGYATRGKQPNILSDEVDKAIARDIDAQKATFANKKAKLGERDNLFGRMMNVYDNKEKATHAARVAAMGRVDRDLQRLQIEAKDPAAAARIAEQRLALQEKKLTLMKEFYGVTVREQSARTPDRVMGGSAPRLTNPQAVYEGYIKNGHSPKDAAELMVKGGLVTKQQAAQLQLSVPPSGEAGSNNTAVPGYGSAKTPQDADRARKAIAANANVLRLAARIKSNSTDAWDRMTPAKRAKVQSDQALLLLALKESKEMGAVDQGLIDLAEKMIGDPGAVLDFGGRLAGLDSVVADSQNGLTNMLNSMGIRAPDGTERVPARGEVVDGFRGANETAK